MLGASLLLRSIKKTLYSHSLWLKTLTICFRRCCLLQELQIRPIKPGEHKAVRGIVGRTFPLLQRGFFSFTEHTFVSVSKEDILGGVVLKLFSGKEGEKRGVVNWIFVTPKAQGLGIGRQLLEFAMQFFKEQGCSEVLAVVEGYNTDSSHLFAREGFCQISFQEQVRLYGRRLPWIWVKAFHLFDITSVA